MKFFTDLIEMKVVNEEEVFIYGCYDSDTPDNEYEFYDIFLDGECINYGDPFYEYPSDDIIKQFL